MHELTPEQAEAAIRTAKSRPGFAVLLEAAIVGWDPLGEALPEIIDLLRDPPLQRTLRGALACDVDLERALTHLRRAILLRCEIDADVFEFACALAHQGFNNGYAWFAADDETERLRALEREIEDLLAGDATPSAAIERLLAVFSLYAPLHRLPQWRRMLAWRAPQISEAFRLLWQEQVAAHEEELAIREQIAALTPIRDAVSAEVRAQYEESPYPRWFSFDKPAPQPRAGAILVAGCGTGKHPVHTALAYPGCEVLAVDLSRASLAYATRMARRFGAGNLSFRQADLLELATLDRRFELIETIGVLHHLANPVAGWRVLAGLLAPGGLMRLALYSELARAPLAATRAFIHEHGFEATAQGIRLCRRAILDLPDEHPARTVIESDDFFSSMGFRDLVMHVCEHRFTLPQIAGVLEELGLELHAFESAPDVAARFREIFPAQAAAVDLACWHRFEERHPHTFRGMYRFCCRKAAV